MKKELKLGLPQTSKAVLEMINKGDDFVVDGIEKEILMLMPILKHDIAPHVCDFVKAGVPKDVIAYYFAYLIANEYYDVYSEKTGKELRTKEKMTVSDYFRFGKVEDKYYAKVEAERAKRVKAKNNEKAM